MKLSRRGAMARGSALAATAMTYPWLTARGQPGSAAVQRVALCIGLNRVNPAFYQGWSGRLGGCHNDQQAMFDIARSKGFAVRCLRDQHATRESVLQSIRYAGERLNSGDAFLISYAGHGSFRRDAEHEGNERDLQDESWCLFDGMLFDDELMMEWRRFRRGVRILVVSDSCHSGTVARLTQAKLAEFKATAAAASAASAASPGGEALSLVFDAITAKFDALIEDIEQGRIPAGVSPIREMPEFVRQKILNDPALAAKYAAISRSVDMTKRELREACAATVLLLAAAQDDQSALDTGTNGLFTKNLAAVWDEGRFVGDYRRFKDVISSRLRFAQTPNLDSFGENPRAFEELSPFAF